MFQSSQIRENPLTDHHPHRHLTNSPADVEYALHFLPVLAALLLSGHIRKGDTVDLPLPHPEVWDQVVTWVYTGKPEAVSPKVRSVIEYLGGVFDEE